MTLTTTDTLQIREKPQGLALLTKGMNLAIGAARRDMECDLDEVQDLHTGRWFDTEGGMFIGECPSDRDFRAMTMQSIIFLEEVGRLERHPERLNLVRYVERG